jgi:hypothetical protein
MPVEFTRCKPGLLYFFTCHLNCKNGKARQKSVPISKFHWRSNKTFSFNMMDVFWISAGSLVTQPGHKEKGKSV